MNIQQDPSTIHQRIEANAQALQELLPLPSLPLLQGRIAELTPRAIIDPTAKSDLVQALERLDKARDVHQKHETLKAEQKQLQQELQQFEHSQRLARIELADKRVTEARQEFDHAARQLCKAFRTLLNADLNGQRTVPGYRPRVMPRFDIPAFNGNFNSYTTSETMTMGPLPWEK